MNLARSLSLRLLLMFVYAFFPIVFEEFLSAYNDFDCIETQQNESFTVRHKICWFCFLFSFFLVAFEIGENEILVQFHG